MAQRYYRELECPDYDTINREILSWIEQKQIIDDSKVFWNPIDTFDFIKYNVSFSRWCLSQQIKIKNIVITVLKDSSFLLRPHIDTLPARYKLSWPVLNAENTYNRWYKLKSESAEHVINSLGGIAYTDMSQLVEIAKRKLSGPALIDAGTIHDVELSSDQIYPRVGLQCQLYNEPEFL